jgi:hypothetical protein
VYPDESGYSTFTFLLLNFDFKHIPIPAKGKKKPPGQKTENRRRRTESAERSTNPIVHLGLNEKEQIPCRRGLGLSLFSYLAAQTRGSLHKPPPAVVKELFIAVAKVTLPAVCTLTARQSVFQTSAAAYFKMPTRNTPTG